MCNKRYHRRKFEPLFHRSIRTCNKSLRLSCYLLRAQRALWRQQRQWHWLEIAALAATEKGIRNTNDNNKINVKCENKHTKRCLRVCHFRWQLFFSLSHSHSLSPPIYLYLRRHRRRRFVSKYPSFVHYTGALPFRQFNIKRKMCSTTLFT